MKKSVIVTGGNGYIGSHMCKYLYNQGYDVHIIDNFSTSPNKEMHKYGVFHKKDIADSEYLHNLFSKISPEAIFHFAARAVVPESEADPMLYYKENLSKTVMLLDAAIKSKVPKFIFSSTCATFGIPQTNQLNELHPQKPINTYGKTKLLMEEVMKDLAQKKIIDVIIFRYFNAAGCSPETEIGENHDPETHLIPNICLNYISNGKKAFHIFGNDFDTPDGTCIRDYIHVDDLARAHFLGMKFLDTNQGVYDFNLGTENGYSVKEVVDTFEKVSKYKVDIINSKRREGDPPRLVGDSTKAKKLLGFSCSYNLEDVISHSLKYFIKVHGNEEK